MLIPPPHVFLLAASNGRLPTHLTYHNSPQLPASRTKPWLKPVFEQQWKKRTHGRLPMPVTVPPVKGRTVYAFTPCRLVEPKNAASRCKSNRRPTFHPPGRVTRTRCTKVLYTHSAGRRETKILPSMCSPHKAEGTAAVESRALYVPVATRNKNR